MFLTWECLAVVVLENSLKLTSSCAVFASAPSSAKLRARYALLVDYRKPLPQHGMPQHC